MAAQAERGAPEEGVIVGIEDGVASVLVGQAGEEWFFPLGMLPDGVEAGTPLRLVAVDAHYEVLGVADARPNADIRSMDARLERMRTDRRNLSDLRPLLDQD